MTNPTAIETLGTFAEQHGELQFAHLCTAALHQDAASWNAARADASSARGHSIGCDCTECSLIREESVFARDAWAVERIAPALEIWTRPSHWGPGDTTHLLFEAIRSTDTTRPDGGTARCAVEV